MDIWIIYMDIYNMDYIISYINQLMDRKHMWKPL